MFRSNRELLVLKSLTGDNIHNSQDAVFPCNSQTPKTGGISRSICTDLTTYTQVNCLKSFLILNAFTIAVLWSLVTSVIIMLTYTLQKWPLLREDPPEPSQSVHDNEGYLEPIEDNQRFCNIYETIDEGIYINHPPAGQRSCTVT